jgi:tetratricopeptide (TPR) repeat protein
MEGTMKKNLFIAVFLLMVSVFSFGQLSKGLKGKVLDRDGKPVSDCVVKMVDKSNTQNKYEIKTDKDGMYIYAGLPYSSEGYLVSVKVGDLPEVQKVVKVRTLEMVELDFDMRKDLVMKEEAGSSKPNPAAEAQELFKNEDYQGAILKADEALKGEDKTYEATILLIKARSFEKLNKFDDELETYLKYLELYPKSNNEKEIVGRVADIYDKKGDKTNSEKYKKRFKELGGTITAENYNEGVKRLNEGNAAEAIPFFKKAIEDDPKDAEAHRELARALVQTGDYTGTIEHLKIYLKMKPDAEDAQIWKDAIKGLEQMIKK